MDFLREEPSRWRWSTSLAGAAPDPTHVYRVVEIGTTVVRERCGKVGIVPGVRIRPLISTGEKLAVEFPDDGRRIATVEITYDWYIRVEPEARVSLPPRRPRRRLAHPERPDGGRSGRAWTRERGGRGQNRRRGGCDPPRARRNRRGSPGGLRR